MPSAPRSQTISPASTMRNGRSRLCGWWATDGSFATGTGPLVSGTTLALTMAMAGRRAYCDGLAGPGVAKLRARCSAR
jgi:hypothetical protein